MTQESLRAFAPAKLNLGLEVIRQRSDGFHDLETIFQAIDFGDDLEFSKVKGRDGLRMKVEGLPLSTGPDNLVSQAWDILRPLLPPGEQGLNVRLHKRIPTGSGLGGGSSNAAATLKAISRLWSLKLSPDQMAELALQLGCDVPFFLRGGTAIGRGRGEILEPLVPLSSGAFLLLFPGISVSTTWAFGQVKLGLTRHSYRIRVEQVKAYLARFPSPAMVLKNRLEDAVVPSYPVMGTAAEALTESGAVHVSMSGSGSCLFGTYPDIKSAEEVCEALKERWECRVAAPYPGGAGCETV
ncbi:MAG: 4-(cytidine 5'-diphospho)-2-C-methyl-D-erythritol kinase [Candidatus Krumholzibacteria bacterium]|jgi:4-diphosphocytidyl-2-C-methyl-D-erythritol kinase|nr:4-(cytidine 5'-diphospho)-2-C-methyl-D-erythritol kinase [Candidatus Krumholzibacteria bacterium]MDP6669336.1 4-(cytidine 5'-diphospho)-2-C-methyl-D-erythritol kinase [Candidatus Krumholzibacteria bacterium]MDP6796775.1 4-(cytidine 5'-diphospho)-2-C-methyl-D-erythritol kinase [Candidatus Krumholzibacteria bacterium]MDP7021671.1 4-(cytidine 5'-diphospho)-2-C-methyl-D-erythritol kinase [Candidatus Krumholzibacteria bacterium]